MVSRARPISLSSRSIVTGVALGLAASTAIPAIASEPMADAINLFFVKRSKNANEVHYDAVFDAENCTWVEPHVHSYWRNLEEGPDDYSKIQIWEPPAYGYDVAPIDDRAIEIRLRPLESAKIDRPVTARLAPADDGCVVTTTIAIGGVETEFQAAFIKVAFGWPPYDYFDILGYVDGKKGSGCARERVYERFVKDDGEAFAERPLPEYWRSGAFDHGADEKCVD